MKPANREFTREVNLFNILNSIREAGHISRVEIAIKTGQSRASVTNITALLIAQGAIRESKSSTSSGRGRKRVMLSLNPDAAYTVGIKITDSRLSFAVVDFIGEVKSSLSIPFNVADRSEDALADLLEDGVRHCVGNAKLDIEDLAGCGVAIPGFVDSATGHCHWNPLRKGKTNIRSLLAERLKIDVYLENDANAVTVASQWFGLGKGVTDFLVVTIEQGVGMGMVVDGQLYRGHIGIGSEFGHLIVKPDGLTCRCGKKGCLEAYASDSAILERARKILVGRENQEYQTSVLNNEDVREMARRGDTDLKELFREGGEILGLGISGLIQIFNPQCIIITGEGVRAGDLLFAPMYRAIRKFTNKPQAKNVEIVIQQWSDNDWARGAAGFVLGELYKSPLKKIHSAD